MYIYSYIYIYIYYTNTCKVSPFEIKIGLGHVKIRPKMSVVRAKRNSGSLFSVQGRA